MFVGLYPKAKINLEDLEARIMIVNRMYEVNLKLLYQNQTIKMIE